MAVATAGLTEGVLQGLEGLQADPTAVAQKGAAASGRTDLLPKTAGAQRGAAGMLPGRGGVQSSVAQTASQATSHFAALMESLEATAANAFSLSNVRGTFQTTAVTAGVTAGVATASGEKNVFEQGIRTVLAAATQTVAARAIGDIYRRGHIDFLVHKLGHVLAGAGSGALFSDDPVAGAIGAGTAELVADSLPVTLAPKTRADLGRLMAGLTALVTEQDVNLANMAANTSLVNNFWLHPAPTLEIEEQRRKMLQTLFDVSTAEIPECAWLRGDMHARLDKGFDVIQDWPFVRPLRSLHERYPVASRLLPLPVQGMLYSRSISHLGVDLIMPASLLDIGLNLTVAGKLGSLVVKGVGTGLSKGAQFLSTAGRSIASAEKLRLQSRNVINFMDLACRPKVANVGMTWCKTALKPAPSKLKPTSTVAVEKKRAVANLSQVNTPTKSIKAVQKTPRALAPTPALQRQTAPAPQPFLGKGKHPLGEAPPPKPPANRPQAIPSQAQPAHTRPAQAKPAAQPPDISKLTKSYVRDMEARSGLKIPVNQKQILKNQLQTKKFEKMQYDQYMEHKKAYNDPKIKKRLRQEWEQNTGQNWPEYNTQVRENGQLVDQMVPAQIHHVVPQKVGGAHEWWNIHPVPQAGHQGGIHGSGSPLNQIIKKTEQK